MQKPYPVTRREFIRRGSSVSALLLLGSLSQPASFLRAQNVNDFNRPSTPNEEPLFVFPAISDVHIEMGRIPESKEKFKKALLFLNKVAPRQDAFLIGGDLVSYSHPKEYDGFMEIWNSCALDTVKDTNKQVFAVGNHEFWYYDEDKKQGGQYEYEPCMKLWKQYFPTAPYAAADKLYYSRVINGYHFIILGSEDPTVNGLYTDGQIEWLRGELDKIKNAPDYSPTKPIFFVAHEPFRDTVYGSYDVGPHNGFSWSIDRKQGDKIIALLKEYPQIIAFSGHSHYSLIDPLWIYQKDFTCINTETLSYTSLEEGMVQPDNLRWHPEIITNHGTLVKVFKDRVEIQRYDFHYEREIGAPAVIDMPADPSRFRYTLDRDKIKPLFKDGDKLHLDGNSRNTVTLSFPQASDNELVHSYKIQARNQSANAVDSTVSALSEFYKYPMPVTLSFTLGGLKPATDYTLEVIAVDSFKNESLPLTANYKTPDIVLAVPEARFPFNGNLLNSSANSKVRAVDAGIATTFGNGRTPSARAANFNSNPANPAQSNFLDLGYINYDQAFSLSFWIKIIDYRNDPAIIANKDWSSGGNTGFALLAKDGKFRLNIRPADGDREDLDLATINKGQWQHLALTVNRQSGELVCYLDGSNVFTHKIKDLDKRSLVPDGFVKTFVGEDGTGAYNHLGNSGAALQFAMQDLRLASSIRDANDVAAEFRGN